MTVRTIQNLGYGFGDTPATIVAKINGNVVFSGEIPTAPTEDFDPRTSLQALLFTFNTTVGAEETVSAEIEVTNSGVLLTRLAGNYSKIYWNPLFTPEQIEILSNPDSSKADRVAIYASYATPPFTAEEISFLETTDATNGDARYDLLLAHGVAPYEKSGPDNYAILRPDSNTVDPRSNVAINGVLQPSHPAGSSTSGTWYWHVKQGEILTCNIFVNAGIE
jgi:hypothetical protein